MKIKRSGILAALVGAIALGLVSQNANAEWPQDVFETDHPVNVKKSDADARKKQFSDALRQFVQLTFLSPDDAKSYAHDMQQLIGNYAYVDDDGKLVLVGKNFRGRDITVQLKDELVFKGIVKKGFNAGLKIPFLQVDITNNQIADLSIQDVGIVQSKFTADLIACRFPVSHRENAKKTQYFFVSAATATAITKRTFEERAQGGAGIVSVINFSGRNYVSSDFTHRQHVISVSMVPVSPVAPELCSNVFEKLHRSVSRAPEGRIEITAARDSTRAIPTPITQASDIASRVNKSKALVGRVLQIKGGK